MRRALLIALSAFTLTAFSGATALGCIIVGKVACPNDRIFPQIVVEVTDSSGTVVASERVGQDGLYMITLADAGTFTVKLTDLPAGITEVKYRINSGAFLDGDSVTIPFAPNSTTTLEWLVDGPACGSCWLTGGGAYIDPLLRLPMATQGGKKGKPEHSFGGNVYPGCSPTAGDGGNWNHVTRDGINLHFRGTHIEVVQCGNVTPPPPAGSHSPETPFNFIEFKGVGTLKGVHGNKADFGTVLFFARAEDHNEPGSKGANDGSLIDRYYLRVYQVIENVEVDLLVISNGSGATEPKDLVVPITDGNLQLHVSSCDNPPVD
jgi:hypothetical protein